MAVYSSQIPLGSPLPRLTLPDLTGTPHSFVGLRGEGVLVVVFSCNHCPYVQHLEQALGQLAAQFAGQPVTFAAVCSNDVEAYPDDDIPGLTNQAQRAGWQFVYLVDREQTAAREFGAVCTPDFFVYDVNGHLGYRGAFDESTPGNQVAVTGDDLRNAVELLIATKPVPEPQRPAMGCSIKWRQ
jgi:thiol-disulfide isomerase/thioredoxin